MQKTGKIYFKTINTTPLGMQENDVVLQAMIMSWLKDAFLRNTWSNLEPPLLVER